MAVKSCWQTSEEEEEKEEEDTQKHDPWPFGLKHLFASLACARSGPGALASPRLRTRCGRVDGNG